MCSGSCKQAPWKYNMLGSHLLEQTSAVELQVEHHLLIHIYNVSCICLQPTAGELAASRLVCRKEVRAIKLNPSPVETTMIYVDDATISHDSLCRYLRGTCHGSSTNVHPSHNRRRCSVISRLALSMRISSFSAIRDNGSLLHEMYAVFTGIWRANYNQ